MSNRSGLLVILLATLDDCKSISVEMQNISCCNERCSRRQTSSDCESQSLLSSSSSKDGVMHFVPLHWSPLGICIKSKVVSLVLLWSVFIGCYYSVINSLTLWQSYIVLDIFNSNLLPTLVFCFCQAFIGFSFPLSGYIADVHCGRLRTILFSMFLILCCTLIFVPFHYLLVSLFWNSSVYRIIYYIVGSFTLVTGTLATAGYCANYIQFGLDQLLEAPSHHQALYVHWAKWNFDLMSTVVVVLFAFIPNMYQQPNLVSFRNICFTAIFTVIITFIVLCVFSYWKRHWFYTEPGRHNPYKMVFKVLNFARKHKYPLQRSAFTYCDDEKPSRLDFCKEKFGGPFTTEQVEDVKTFLKIVLVLMCIGPVFVMDLPAENIIMYFFEVHLGAPLEFRWISIVVNGGILKSILSTIFLPIYMWIIFSVMRNRVPSILRRLGFGIVVYFLGIVSFFMLDIYGHSHDNGECIFNFTINATVHIPQLKLNWAMYVPSNILIGIGPTLVTVTIFEFISAQSPHSMKGFLLGTYFAISGFYQFVSSCILIPFSLDKVWASGDYPPHTGCVFGYFIVICTIALIGVVLYLIAAKRYVNRERDDRPYDQRFVIDVYDRYLSQVSDEEYPD